MFRGSCALWLFALPPTGRCAVLLGRPAARERGAVERHHGRGVAPLDMRALQQAADTWQQHLSRLAGLLAAPAAGAHGSGQAGAPALDGGIVLAAAEVLTGQLMAVAGQASASAGPPTAVIGSSRAEAAQPEGVKGCVAAMQPAEPYGGARAHSGERPTGQPWMSTGRAGASEHAGGHDRLMHCNSAHAGDTCDPLLDLAENAAADAAVVRSALGSGHADLDPRVCQRRGRSPSSSCSLRSSRSRSRGRSHSRSRGRGRSRSRSRSHGHSGLAAQHRHHWAADPLAEDYTTRLRALLQQHPAGLSQLQLRG